jgi:hypothetical protein
MYNEEHNIYCICVGAKGITIMNLARLGLVKPLKSSIFHSPTFNNGYKLLSEYEIKNLHSNILDLLRSTDPYGPFEALTEFVGSSLALEIAKEGECPFPCSTIASPGKSRPITSPGKSSTHGSPSKRQRWNTEDHSEERISDDEMMQRAGMEKRRRTLQF